jgi:hypothetical protein
VEASFVSHHGHFLKKMERALGVLLEERAQKGLSVDGAVVRETAMWLKQPLHKIWG